MGRIHRLIDDHFNNIRLVETSYCDVPYEILLGVGRFDPARLMTAASNGDHHHQRQPVFDTWSYETDRPLSLAALERAARKLPGGVFRCKGIVHLAEEPERPAVLQVVCRRGGGARGGGGGGGRRRARRGGDRGPGGVAAGGVGRGAGGGGGGGALLCTSQQGRRGGGVAHGDMLPRDRWQARVGTG